MTANSSHLVALVNLPNTSDEGRRSLRWVFSLRELRSATNSFNYDNKIGEGPLGSVYWGQVWDGSQIAVKRLNNAKNGTEAEFASEVEILGRIRHKNLLSFRGYCADGPERVLVYDFMANSSLYAHLHGPHSAECLLDWRRRASIAMGTARALLYLHRHATPKIIHGSVKATNVLLDSDFRAHAGDFGLARLIPDDGTDHEKIASSESQRGYLAPEYAAMSGKPTAGCDVYSFGIILLELASGRRPVEKSGSGKACGIRSWVLPLARQGRYDEIADSKLGDKFSGPELRRMVLVGLACTRSEPEKRPTMLQVVPLLKGESKETLVKLEREELFSPDSTTVSSQGTPTPDGSTDSAPPLKKDKELVGA
ncbi:putative protein kinase superfamily protein isoform X1 [Zea mays]|uniref:putative protein kinase superfamily protein isoform X1 n=1 Tax=Zea mays TaxID=4577 RepID=UPI0004DE9278|nr:putative protein kinase superfamily protein isoform X1 [Zea mays]|eukprot:XP_008658224.1 putative protein kinase superfamily protein isoform X1 [Zea mays]